MTLIVCLLIIHVETVSWFSVCVVNVGVKLFFVLLVGYSVLTPSCSTIFFFIPSIKWPKKKNGCIINTLEFLSTNEW